MNSRLFFLGIAAAIGCEFFAGCSGNDRIGIDGTVTLDGKPLDNGLINFQPTAETAAPSSGGRIANGSYELPASSGLMPGEYRVVIQAYRKTGKKTVDLQTQKAIFEFESVKIRESGSLKATVVRGGVRRFDFAVTSTP